MERVTNQGDRIKNPSRYVTVAANRELREMNKARSDWIDDDDPPNGVRNKQPGGEAREREKSEEADGDEEGDGGGWMAREQDGGWAGNEEAAKGEEWQDEQGHVGAGGEDWMTGEQDGGWAGSEEATQGWN